MSMATELVLCALQMCDGDMLCCGIVQDCVCVCVCACTRIYSFHGGMLARHHKGIGMRIFFQHMVRWLVLTDKGSVYNILAFAQGMTADLL